MSLLFPLSLLSLYVYYLFSTPDTSHLVCVFLSFCVNVSCVCLRCLCFINSVSISLSLILNGSIDSSLSLLLAHPSHPILVVDTNMGIWETDLRAERKRTRVCELPPCASHPIKVITFIPHSPPIRWILYSHITDVKTEVQKGKGPVQGHSKSTAELGSELGLVRRQVPGAMPG